MRAEFFGLSLMLTLAAAVASGQPKGDILVLGDPAVPCTGDPHCINRLHPAIPMTARARPGQTIVMKARNAGEFSLDPQAPPDPRAGDPEIGQVHPLTGPVHIDGARAGDVLAVRLLDVRPGPWAYTVITPSGLVSDVVSGPIRVLWRLGPDHATSDDLPGVRIPNASFPGVVTVLPGPEQHRAMLAREAALAAVDGAAMQPHANLASPPEVCGPEGSHADTCLRTIPPREHGGNLDIRYLQAGVTVYLPCQIDGCGLALGDPHYAQGDGEVSGTALEMDATFTLVTEVLPGDTRSLDHGPHFEGPVRLLDIPSRRFYATTGFPLKAAGEALPDMAYLRSDTAVGLENLSRDLDLAARNALLAMIDHVAATYGYTREQAYVIASVAVDLRIGQVVDAPNVGVTALLPLDIFVDPPAR